MSEPGQVSSSIPSDNSGGAKQLTEEQKKQAALKAEQEVAAARDQAIQDGLSGSKAGVSSQSESLSQNAGTSIFGMNNSGVTVDQQKLNEITNQMLDFTMKASAMPFGIGAHSIENSIGQFFQAIMSCFKFEPLQLPSMPTLSSAPSAPTSPGTPGTPGTSESPSTPSAPGTPSTPAEQATPAQPSAPASETPASQSNSKYSKYGNGNLYKLDGDSGNRYVLRDGKYVKVDSWGKNGEYVINNVRYDNNGKVITKPAATRMNSVKNAAGLGSNIQKGVDTVVSQQFTKSQLTSLIDSNPSKYQVVSTQTDANGNITMKFNVVSGRFVSQRYTMTFDKSGNPTTIREGAESEPGTKTFNIKYDSNGHRSEMTQDVLGLSYPHNYGKKWTYNEDGSQRSYEKYRIKTSATSKTKEVVESSQTSAYAKGQSQPKGKIPEFSCETPGYSNTYGSIRITQGDHVWTKSGDKFVRTNSKTGEVTTFDKDGNRTEYYNPSSGYKTSYSSKSYTVKYNADWKK